MHYGITRRIHVILDEWRVAMVRENQNQAVFDHVANALCLGARRKSLWSAVDCVCRMGRVVGCAACDLAIERWAAPALCVDGH